MSSSEEPKPNRGKKRPKGKRNRKEGTIVGFLGVGLDNKDGEHRLTRNEHFFLVGGSQETHDRMQETAIKFTEALKQRGKPLQKTSIEEVLELFDETRE